MAVTTRAAAIPGKIKRGASVVPNEVSLPCLIAGFIRFELFIILVSSPFLLPN